MEKGPLPDESMKAFRELQSALLWYQNQSLIIHDKTVNVIITDVWVMEIRHMEGLEQS
jgi:hypothetical protein